MRQLVAITLNDIRVAFSSRTMWVTTLLLPVLFTAILAMGDRPREERVPLLVLDEDRGPVAAQIIAEIDALRSLQRLSAAEGFDVADREEALASLEEAGRLLILPAGLSEDVASGEGVVVDLYLATNHDPTRTRAAEQAIAAILARSGDARATARGATEEAERLRPFASAAERQRFFDDTLALAERRKAERVITVRAAQATRLEPEIARGAAQSSPGQLVTFTLITLLGTSAVLVDERRMGTLRRLLTCPLRPGTILAGKTMGRFGIGLLQMALLIGVGQWLFGVAWGRNPLALALLLFAFALSAVAIGLFLATVARTAEQASQMTTAAALIIAAIGGAWWPLEIVGGPLRAAAWLLPSGWAMSGFQAIILRGAGVADIATHLAILLGFAALFFLLGIRRFSFE